MVFKTLSEIVEVLAGYAPSRMSSVVYNLERIHKLLDALDTPQNSLKVIHITGTSGKTSTAYFARSLLEAAGAKVGLVVSPHIHTITERVQIHGGPMADDQFIQYFNEFHALIDGFEPKPTYFELMTAFAYWVFAKEHVDYAVVEVGMGGRYDATNVITRQDKVCIINSIGLDHTDMLGETLAEIAFEKAGIVQDSNAVFTVPQDAEARNVLEAEAIKKHTSLTLVTPEFDTDRALPLFQQQNFQLARAAVEYVVHRDGLSLPADVNAVAEGVAVPGRFETHTLEAKTIILDGAHNPQKLEAFITAFYQHSTGVPLVIAGFSGTPPEEKLRTCVELVSSFSKKVLYTTFTIQRDVLRSSVPLETIAPLKRLHDELYADARVALDTALESDEKTIVITGSLYLVAFLRPLVRKRAGLSD